MELKVLDKTGKEAGKVKLNDSVFAVSPKMTILKQYVRVYLANQRQGTASTKGRGEVSGGGKKPWRQKGTGRARVGSSRNPLWVHGGISHGPKPKSWNLKLSKKMKKWALLSALTLKATNKDITIIEDISIKTPKTSEFLSLLKKIQIDSRGLLIVLDKHNPEVIKSVNNIKGVSSALVDNLNAYETLKAHRMLIVKEAVTKLNSKYEVK